MEPFLNCASASGAVTKLEYQFNKQSDIDNNIWYKDEDDFKASEWQKTTSISTSDGTLSGASRQATTVDSFTQAIENTIKEEYASAFLKRLFVESSAGDKHFRDLLDHGLNARITTLFGDGTFIRETNKCMTITDYNEPFKQLSNGDSEVTLNTQLNWEPTVENVGVGFNMPNGIEDVSVTIAATVAESDVTVNLSNIQDPSSLIVPTEPAGKEWKVALFNETTGELVGELTNDGTEAYAFTAVPSGKYIAAAYYSIMVDGTTVYYNAVKTTKAEVA